MSDQKFTFFNGGIYLDFDGPNESLVCTVYGLDYQKKYGHLFAAAPEMFELLERFSSESVLEENWSDLEKLIEDWESLKKKMEVKS